MTTRLRRLADRGSRPVFWLALRLVPPRRHAVVHGWPLLEGNVVELLPRLNERYPHDVHWLVDDDPEVARQVVRERGWNRVRVVEKSGLTAVWLALGAELTFYTHGLFTAVEPPGNRLVVNLWHGDGPKATGDAEDIRSTVVVTGARMWQRYKAETFGVSEQDVAWTGNPRSVALQRPVTDEQRARLGLDPAAALVLWLPTFRIGSNHEGRHSQDGAPLSARAELRTTRQAMGTPGVQVVVKPHPMDRDDYSSLGVGVLTDADLRRAGVALYELLGSSTALLSDTSSAWVDYVALDRPIAFVLPDVDELRENRGFNVPDLISILPGPVLRDVEDVNAWLERVARDPSDPTLRHAAERERLGVAPLGDSATRLLDWLDAYQRRRGRRPLFGSSPPAAGTETSDVAAERQDRERGAP
ncbi:CDP-glycerol glycerophosphotransferase, TagB/SpsB family [Geodermatophilus saharensis]|uniref:CDP-glycerol glycerophosphotransferase, TagB/SpsB family n=1 Tax=Geodermatophilus saharensis TaxID=1137994 RepID=A0A239IA25_9ACTN|nr:CDP-glycerol glycerophosphotransferase family protein [Geodermatophilus saharensis]SNS90425.1 CDP-glycerol glycerophosphotransferase, TagB/SpsB family [Geodermatophilus saharensis]